MTDNSPAAETASFGYWVRRRRLALDLTQAALARSVGCSTATIKKIEYDERRPSRQMAVRLADSLAISEEEQEGFIARALGERPVHTMPVAHQPVRPSTADIPPEIASHIESSPPVRPFAGREEELAALRRSLDEAVAGDGRVVFINGEAGRGKTALLTHFAGLALAEDERLVAAGGNCSAVAGLGDPYLPFREMLLDLMADFDRRGPSGWSIPAKERRLWEFAPLAAETIGRLGDPLVDTLVPAASLRRWLSSQAADRPVSQPAAQPRFDPLTAVLHARAQQRPLLLLIDDLQWADAASVSLLFHLGRRLAGSRILLVGAFRPSEIASASAEAPGQTLQQVIFELRRLYGEIILDLEEFDLARARRLTDALVDLEPNRLPESFRVHLFWQTRGHPLFLVELLREMKARRHLVQDRDGRWVEGDPADWEALPTRVTAVIEQRLARLDESERRLLEAASVEGERFSGELAAILAGLDEADGLLRGLAHRHGLIREAGSSRVGDRPLSLFQFNHVMFQHYLYESLGENDRRRLHERLAVALEEAYRNRPEEALSLLAHHFHAADRGDQAVPYLLQAGDRARNLYAHREAAEHYRRALTFLRAGGSREAVAKTLMKLGLTYQSAFDYERAQEAFDEAFALWPQAVPPPAPRPDQVLNPAGRAAPHPLRLVWGEPPSLDPTLGGYNLSAPVATQLFSGLVDYGPDSEVLPDAADRWEILDGGRRYVFHLRDDVYWSDGVPVTAHDFEFTYRRALDPATRAPIAGQLLYPIRGARAFHRGEHADPQQIGVRAVDERTLEFELEAPTSFFIHNLAYYVSLPVPRHVVARHGAAWARPEHIVTNGPFLLAGWEHGRSMRFERNPHFHGDFSGNLEAVHLSLNVPSSDQIALYEADELDVVTDLFTAMDDIATLHRRFPKDYQRRQSFVTFYYYLEIARSPFSDRRVRRALAMALDRRSLADVALKGYALPAVGGFVPPGMPGHLSDAGLVFDPAAARRLLVEAGFAGGRGCPPLKLFVSANRRVMGQFVIDSWNAVLGLQAQLHEVVDSADWVKVRSLPDLKVFLGGWWADYPDPDNFLRVDVDLDLPNWEHEGFRTLIAEAGRIADQEQRLQRYLEAEQILADEVPLLPLVYMPLNLIIKPWIQRYPTAAVKYPGFWKDVIIDP